MAVWKIEAEQKINKTRVLVKGSDDAIKELKKKFPHFKTSDIYPVISGYYDFQIFFYTVLEEDVNAFSRTLEEFYSGKFIPEASPHARDQKTKNIILSGVIALIILITAGYFYYTKFSNKTTDTPAPLEIKALAQKKESQAIEEKKNTDTELEKVEKNDTPKIENSFEISEQIGFSGAGIDAGISSSSGSSDRKSSAKLKVIFVDVDQADAIIIITSTKKCFVIDSGDEKEHGEKVLDILKRNSVKKIEILVLTHPHKDHIGGALHILKNFDVKSVYDSGKPNSTRIYTSILQEIKRKNIDYIQPRRGKEFKWTKKLKAKILHPVNPKEEDNINNSSIVIQLEYRNVKMLFMGDLEKDRESELVKEFGSNLKSQILKVGHHGSSTSSCKSFLDKVQPQYCFIEVGKNNKFRHPNQGTISRLKEYGKIYRTDQNGDIELETNGSDIKIKSQR